MPSISNFPLSKHALFNSLILAISVIFTGQSPFISLIVLMAIYLFQSKFFTSKTHIAYCVIFSFQLAIIVASRRYNATESDDFFHYYHAYGLLNSENLLLISGGIEISAWLIILLIKNLPVILTPTGLMFSYSFIVLFFYFFAVIKILRDKKNSVISLCVVLLLFQSEPVLSTQLIRQFAATPYLVLAIFSTNKKSLLINLALAASFHISSTFLLLPVVILLNSSLSDKHKASATFVIFITLVFFYFVGLDISFLTGKIDAYSDASSSNGSSIIASQAKTLMLSYLLYCSFILIGISSKNEFSTHRKFIIVIAYIALIYFSTSNLTIVYRILFPFTLMYFWVLIFKSTQRINFYASLLVLILIGRHLKSWIFYDNLNPLSFWSSYGLLDMSPYYFISKFF